MSAQKKSSCGAGRPKVLAAGVDSVAIPCADENAGDDSEVCSFFDVFKIINNLSSLKMEIITTTVFGYLILSSIDFYDFIALFSPSFSFNNNQQSSLFLSFLPVFFYICWTIKINLKK